jgi:capsular exopolysaccharide synthesis family protein
VAEEGKSLLTLNMAMSLAHGGQQKVLVIDADLRKPGICRALRVDDREGIKEWYRSDRAITGFIQHVAGVQVWVLPAGLEDVDPVEVLSSSRMASLLTAATAAFDWVLIDSSPLLPMADAGMMSRISDATVIVIRRDKTPKSALKEALDRVAPAKMLGFLLNDFPSVSHYSYERYGAKHRGDKSAANAQFKSA